MEKTRVYYSFENNIFYFEHIAPSNGYTTSEGYSIDEVPYHAIEISDDEYDLEFDEFEGTRYVIKDKLLCRVIKEKLVPFTIKIQNYCYTHNGINNSVE